MHTHGAPVEIVKPDAARGTYPHPELYGQPEERGQDFDAYDATGESEVFDAGREWFFIQKEEFR